MDAVDPVRRDLLVDAATTGRCPLRFREDYDNAGVPMLPVVAAPRRVADQILWYAVATVVVSLALVPVAPMGWIYSVSALLLGLVFIWEAVALRQRTRRGKNPCHAPVPLVDHLLGAAVPMVAIDPLLLG